MTCGFSFFSFAWHLCSGSHEQPAWPSEVVAGCHTGASGKVAEAAMGGMERSGRHHVFKR